MEIAVNFTTSKKLRYTAVSSMIDGVTSFHLWTSRSKTNKGPDQSMSNNNFVASREVTKN